MIIWQILFWQTLTTLIWPVCWSSFIFIFLKKNSTLAMKVTNSSHELLPHFCFWNFSRCSRFKVWWVVVWTTLVDAIVEVDKHKPSLTFAISFSISNHVVSSKLFWLFRMLLPLLNPVAASLTLSSLLFCGCCPHSPTADLGLWSCISCIGGFSSVSQFSSSLHYP